MAYEVHEGVFTLEGNNGRYIGTGRGGPSMMFYIQEGSASTTEAVGVGSGPVCWFEVRSNGWRKLEKKVGTQN